MPVGVARPACAPALSGVTVDGLVAQEEITKAMAVPGASLLRDFEHGRYPVSAAAGAAVGGHPGSSIFPPPLRSIAFLRTLLQSCEI
jgi:hypothetical protein